MNRSRIIQIILTVIAAAVSAALGFFGGTTLSGCSSTGHADWDVSTSVWSPITQTNPELGGATSDDKDVVVEWSQDLLGL